MQELAIIQGDINKALTDLSLKSDISMLEKMLSENNHSFIVSVLHKFFNMFQKSPFFANDNDARTFCDNIRQEYTNTNTIRAYILGLRRIFAIGQEYKIMDHNPIDRLQELRFLKIPAAKSDNEKELRVEKPKIDLLITRPEISKRMKAIILFLANTGCRSSELLDFKRDNAKLEYTTIDGKREYYYRLEIYQRKTDRTKIVKVPVKIWDYIKNNINNFENNYSENINSEYLIHNRDGKKLSRQGLYKILNSAWQKIYENDKIGAHQFRHFFATWSLQNGMDLSHLSRLMGHTSINTTAIYDKRLTSSKDHSIIELPEDTKKPEVVQIVIDRSMEIIESMTEKKYKGRPKSKSIFRHKLEDVLPEDAIFGDVEIDNTNLDLTDEEILAMMEKQEDEPEIDPEIIREKMGMA